MTLLDSACRHVLTTSDLKATRKIRKARSPVLKVLTGGSLGDCMGLFRGVLRVSTIAQCSRDISIPVL